VAVLLNQVAGSFGSIPDALEISRTSKVILGPVLPTMFLRGALYIQLQFIQNLKLQRKRKEEIHSRADVLTESWMPDGRQYCNLIL
jgi:hypothetical protein